MGPPPIMLAFMCFAFLIVFLIIFAVLVANFRLWLQAHLSGAQVNMMRLAGMRLRKVNPKVIVHSYIIAVKGGLQISLDQLETHYLAGGNVPRVVQALIAAEKAHYPLSLEQAWAIDLAGRDPVAEVTAGAVDWEYEFDRIDPYAGEPMARNCRDGSRVGASVKVRYSRPVTSGASEKFLLQTAIAARVLAYINDADSLGDLDSMKDTHESELLAYARNAMAGMQSLQLGYTRL
jgi:hypothetical protein